MRSRWQSKRQGFIREFDRHLGGPEVPIKKTGAIRVFERYHGELEVTLKKTRFYKGL